MNGWPFRRAQPPAGDALSEDERRFIAGVRTLADLVAPAAVEVARDHLRLDRQYVRTLTVTGYPRTVEPGWLQPLLDVDAPLELSLHLRPLATAAMVRLLGHKLVQLQSSRLLADRAGRLADPEREVAYADAERLREALQRGDEHVFAAALYLGLRAPTPEALDDLTRRVEGTLQGMLAQSRVAVLEQAAGFRACLPLAEDHLGVTRNLDTSSAATMFPFSAAGLAMDRGILYGVASGSHAPVILDPFDERLDNANMVIFARSGAGKSYFAKLLALRAMFQGVEFLVIDPEDEYGAVCAVAGGQEIRLAAGSGQRLNPFDLPPAEAEDEAGRDPLAEQVVALLALCDVMLAEPGQSLGADARALLEAALYDTYAGAGITRDPATHGRSVPLLRDLYDRLLAEPDAGVLASRLRRYVEGSLAGLFAGPTDVALDGRMTVFNLQALGAELRPLGIHLITQFVWGQVRRARKPRLLLVDEAWSLLCYPQGGAFLGELSRRARKHFLGLVTVTQDVADFLGAEQGRVVLTNAATKLLLKQDASTIGPVVAAFALSGEERQLLLGAGKGEGVLFAQGARVALTVEASPAEHRLATTAPRELAERAPGTAATPTSRHQVAAPLRPRLRFALDRDGGDGTAP